MYQQYNLFGKDVIVALIERGIDYTHPDFIDANGKTRIAYIYDMINTAGGADPDNPYGVGTIFDRAEINQALSTGTALGSTDRYGHGTACTGIAAGDGSGMPGAPFRGVAPEATIIAVKVLHDQFSAIAGIPGQAGFYRPSYLSIALNFVKDKSIELGLPSVTLMNLGSIGGPTDGSSKVARAMADFAAPGRILVCGAGDDGGGDNRAAGTVMQGATLDLTIDKIVSQSVRLEIWYEDTDRFDIEITTPNNTRLGPYISPATNQDQDQQFTTDCNYYHLGSDQDFDQSNNSQRQILVDLKSSGSYTISLKGTTVTNGAFTASLNPANFNVASGFTNNLFQNGSICDFASARNIIVPTSYVLKNNWVDINGISRSTQNQGNPGEIWIGSSTGPTRDGRIGVDVAAPGEVNIGAYSPNTYYGAFSFNQIQNSNGLYGIQSAVSAAAPVVTGVIALMLEVKPDLDPAQVKQILQQSARSDANTGAVPNNVWGYGKLDALGAVQATQLLTSLAPQQSEELTIYPNPTNGKLYYHWKKRGYKTDVLIQNIQGQTIKTLSLEANSGSIDVNDLAAGVYILNLDGSYVKFVKKR